MVKLLLSLIDILGITAAPAWINLKKNKFFSVSVFSLGCVIRNLGQKVKSFQYELLSLQLGCQKAPIASDKSNHLEMLPILLFLLSITTNPQVV